jgi:hypothetical protein
MELANVRAISMFRLPLACVTMAFMRVTRHAWLATQIAKLVLTLYRTVVVHATKSIELLFRRAVRA